MVDFIVAGVNKCGTTWLMKMLKQHPDVFVPEQKELHYFNSKFGEDMNLANPNRKYGNKRYENFFENAKKGQLKGESTPLYLFDQEAPKNIFDYNPDTKIIAILRNPIERAFSQYLYFIQRGVINEITLKEAIEKEHDNIIGRGIYFEQIKRYQSIFPKENFLILYFDDLKKNNKAFLKKIEKFIGVKEFIPENIDEKINVTGKAKYKRLKKFIHKTKKFFVKHNMLFVLKTINKSGIGKITNSLLRKNKKFDKKPVLNENDKKFLYDFFEKDIEKLEKLLEKDLSHWKIQ